MTRFDFVLYHKLGKTMQAEDPLSRWADHEMGIDLNNTNQILLKPEFFTINALEATHESPINDEIILKEVKAALLLNEVTKDYKSLLKSGPREFKKSLQDWNYENGLLLYRGKIYIPHSVEDTLRQQIVQMHHNLPRNTLRVVICVSGWKIAHSNLLDHSCLTRCLTGLRK